MLILLVLFHILYAFLYTIKKGKFDTFGFEEENGTDKLARFYRSKDILNVMMFVNILISIYLTFSKTDMFLGVVVIFTTALLYLYQKIQESYAVCDSEDRSIADPSLVQCSAAVRRGD